MITAVTTGHVLDDIGRGFRESFYMFWETLWPLVLGFALSGAVRAFVPAERIRSRLGSHRPASVARAALYGASSSSCSYAASATARSLFAQGADFVASMVFMVASTNLVIELGVVLGVLIGWTFVAAQFVGGIIMVALLAVGGGLWFRGRALAEARQVVGSVAEGHRGHDDHAGHDGHDARVDEGAHDGRDAHAGHAGHGGHAAHAGHDAHFDHETHDAHAGHDAHGGHAAPPRRRPIRTAAGWSDAAGSTVGDLRMLWKEMLFGFVAAGFLAELVPTSAWNTLFLHGHGGAATVENVVVGPLVAVASFVCSVGNVPLAAALWKGGISFGGVISFIFADLLTLPLLLIYRRQYGARMALRLLAVLFAVVCVAGLITEELFRAAGALPTHRPAVIAADSLHWNVTTVLDLVAIPALLALFWLARSRGRFAEPSRYAIDPICGMQVEMTSTSTSLGLPGGETVWFCSPRCRDRYEAARPTVAAPGST